MLYRPYTHAEVGPHPTDYAPRSLVLVHDVGGLGPGHAVISRTAGTALRHWWTDAARRRPFCRTPAMPRPTLQLGCLGTQGTTPHRLVLVFKSRSLLPRASSRAAAAFHCHPASNPPLSLRPEPEDPVAVSLAPLEPPYATPWLVQHTPAQESSLQWSPPPAWTHPSEFQVSAILVADRLFKPPL
jgi:hypothetical protein